MKHSFFITLSVSLLSLFTTTSCGDDNPLDNPTDMVTQNIMIESVEKNTLGQTDIYITDNLNFKSQDYLLADMGQVLDLGHVEEQGSDLTTITGEAAVTIYEGYMAIHRDNLRRFPSNKVGISIASSYYRIWVDSWLKSNKKKVGAVVNYALYIPSKNELPTPYSVIGLIDTKQGQDSLSVEVSQKDCEFDIDQDARKFATVSIAANKKKLTQAVITLSKAVPSVSGRYELYIRSHNSYTTVYFEVK